MFFAQKIYYFNKPLILTTNSELYCQDFPEAREYFQLKGASQENYKIAFDQIGSNLISGVIIEDQSQKTLQHEMYEFYKPMEAGGGVVINEDNNILMIFRRGKWDLPKGKCDEGEQIENCALREVSEETGLQQLELGEKICDTFHVYAQNGENLLKCTSWYKMTGTKTEELIPQAEENILEAKWIASKDLEFVVSRTYEAIKEVLENAGIYSAADS